jgi:hypothetical protein
MPLVAIPDANGVLVLQATSPNPSPTDSAVAMVANAINTKVEIVVPTVGDLTTTVDDGPQIGAPNGFADGHPAWVVAAGPSHGFWCLDRTSVAPVNGVTVVATFSGVGRWVFISSGGPGGNAFEYAITTLAFVQPAVMSSVIVTVDTTALLSAGQTVFIPGAGFMQITNILSPTTLSAANLGTPGSTPPGTVVPAGTVILDGDIGFPDTSVANEAALTALLTAGRPEGEEVYVQTWRQNAKLTTTILPVRAHEIIASDNLGIKWIRQVEFSSFTYQPTWFYNATTGNDENDGATDTTPIQTLDEFCRRVKVFSAAPATFGVAQPYTINFQTAPSASDTWFPSGTIQADGVQISTGGITFAVGLVGFRRFIAVPTGSGALTAAATSAVIATRAKPTLTDATAVFTTLKGRLVMVADPALQVGTGAVASITAVVSGIATLIGGTGFTTASVNNLITITGAATAANNGTFPITKFISATSVEYSNPGAFAPDLNNGAISWNETVAKISWILNAPAFTSGSFAGIASISAGIATFTGGAGFAVTDIGKQFRISGSALGNDGEYTILTVPLATSVTAARIGGATPVVEVAALAFQGVVEMGPNWFSQATLLAVAAPASLSPYCVVTQPIMTNRVWGIGAPKTMSFTYTDIEFGSSGAGIGSLGLARFTSCRATSSVAMIPGQGGGGLPSEVDATLCCWSSAGAFGNITFQGAGEISLLNSCSTDFNWRIREKEVGALPNSFMCQGGYFGDPSVEAGPRIGARTIDVLGATGLAVFNNVNGSATNPSVASGSAGAAVILARDAYMGCASAAVGSRIWGIGALVGLHDKEGSMLMLGTTAQPTVTDSAGSAGFPVNELKIDNNAVIPEVDAVFGVPNPAGSVTTGTTVITGLITAVTDGIATILDPNQVFSAESVGRSITITNSPGNNGVFIIQSFIVATSVTYRDPTAVVDLSGAVGSLELPIITRWSQLFAATPYAGNAINQVNGTKVMRVVEV